MYKVFAYSPQFVPLGAYQTYEEALKVVKQKISSHFKIEMHQENENGDIIDIKTFKSPSYVGYF